MNDLEDRIRTSLHAAADRLPESKKTTLEPQRSPAMLPRARGPLIAVMTITVIMITIGAVTFILDGADHGETAVGGPETPIDSLSSDTSWNGSSVVADTVADGTGGTCDPEMTNDTLYLGGPAWEGNSAAQGYLFSLPAGRTASDIATSFVASALVGSGCSGAINVVDESPTEAGRTTVSLSVVPPAVPTAISLSVEVIESEGTIGVGAVSGDSDFEVESDGPEPAIVLGDPPAGAERVSIRFRKGDDVWELSSEPTAGLAVTLAVPSVETDRYPDARPEWVIVTWQDATRVLDAAAAPIP